jgi:hypothetical protein
MRTVLPALSNFIHEMCSMFSFERDVFRENVTKPYNKFIPPGKLNVKAKPVC